MRNHETRPNNNSEYIDPNNPYNSNEFQQPATESEQDFENSDESYKQEIQGRLISALLYDIEQAFSNEETWPQYGNDKEVFLQCIRENKITRENFDKLIGFFNQEMSPEEYDEIYQEVSSDSTLNAILHQNLPPVEERRKLNPRPRNSVETFLRYYPSPADFDKQSQAYLERVRQEEGERSYRMVVPRVEELAQTVYREKQDLYEQYLALEQEANGE